MRRVSRTQGTGRLNVTAVLCSEIQGSAFLPIMGTYAKSSDYCRLSEEERNRRFETDDSNRIQNQKAMLLQYFVEQGWEVYHIYSDDDYTGSDRSRPEFGRLLQDAQQRIAALARQLPVRNSWCARFGLSSCRLKMNLL